MTTLLAPGLKSSTLVNHSLREGLRFHMFEVTTKGRYIHRCGADQAWDAINTGRDLPHFEVWDAVTFTRVADVQVSA